MGKGKDYYGCLSRGQFYDLFMIYITPGSSEHLIYLGCWVTNNIDTSLHEFRQSSGGSKEQILKAKNN